MIQNDTEFQATQYRLAQVEKVVCGLRHELSPRAFADCVQGYILEIQRMREEIDEYLLRPLKVSLLYYRRSDIGHYLPAWRTVSCHLYCRRPPHAC